MLPRGLFCFASLYNGSSSSSMSKKAITDNSLYFFFLAASEAVIISQWLLIHLTPCCWLLLTLLLLLVRRVLFRCCLRCCFWPKHLPIYLARLPMVRTASAVGKLLSKNIISHRRHKWDPSQEDLLLASSLSSSYCSYTPPYLLKVSADEKLSSSWKTFPPCKVQQLLGNCCCWVFIFLGGKTLYFPKYFGEGYQISILRWEGDIRSTDIRKRCTSVWLFLLNALAIDICKRILFCRHCTQISQKNHNENAAVPFTG